MKERERETEGRCGEEGQRKRYTRVPGIPRTTSWAGSEVEEEEGGRRLEPAINRLNLPLDSPF